MKLRRLLRAATLLLPLVAHSQDHVTLSGTLTDPSGAAVARAEVAAFRLPEGAAAARSTTGADGRYALVLPPGRYRVRVTHASFARIEEEFTLAGGGGHAWNPRMALERLAATVVVTAQAEPAEPEGVSAAVTLLTREQIERRQAVWLASLLATTPGFAVSRLGREGGVTTLFVNGGNSNFTKVLVDGATLNEPGGLVDFSNVALENVEKIEVVRGAESALHGSDAMAGVIQIFTRRGATRRPALRLLAEGGRFGTARGSASVSGRFARFDYAAAAGRLETQGQGPNDRFRSTTLSGNFGWRPGEAHTLRLTLRSHASDVGVQGQIALIPPDRDEHNALRSFSGALRWEFSPNPRWRHHLTGTGTYLRQLFEDPSEDFCLSTPPFPCDFPFVVRNAFQRAGLSEQSSYTFPRGRITLGYQYEVESGSFSGTHGRRHNQAGYLEAGYQVGARLRLTAGARAEANGSFGTRVVPRAGAAYALRLGSSQPAFWGATRLRFSYGLGIKEPSLAQSFAQSLCFPGNPDLRPERSRSFTAGAEQTLGGGRGRVSVDAFHNHFRDIVSFAFGRFPGTPPPGCPFGFGSFFNTDLARARGVNAGFEARARRGLRLAGHYTYVDSRVRESPNAFDPALQPGNRLLRRPVHSGSLEVSATAGRTDWTLLGTFVGARTDSDFLGFGLTRNPGYGRADLIVNYDVRPGVTAFGRVENLFDKRYEDAIGFPALGRHYRAGMRFQLGGE